MNTRITVASMTPVDRTHAAERLAIHPEDVSHITDESNSGNCYTFTASGSGNTGTVYMDMDFVAIEWGGDPQWFTPTDEANDDDEAALTLALNGDLSQE